MRTLTGLRPLVPLLFALGCNDFRMNTASLDTDDLPEEECEGEDAGTNEDCDEDDCDESTFYADGDEDGHGDPDDEERACEAPDGYVEDAGDCDDIDPTVYPGAPELCDDIDQDCDGELRDAEATDATTFYADADGDGFGVTDGEEHVACDAPTGFSATGGDCDDQDPGRYPAAPGLCEGSDNDCDGAVGPTEAEAGSTEECAGVDCADVLTRAGADGGDAVYWIDPSGVEPFEAFCDMTTDGGGWTLLAAFPTYDNSMYDDGEAGVRDAFPVSTSDGFGARVSHIEATNLTFTEAIWECARDDGTHGNKTSDSGLIDALRHVSTTVPNVGVYPSTRIEGSEELRRDNGVTDVTGVENWYLRYGYAPVASYNYYFGVNSHNNGAFGECFDAGYGGGRDWRVWAR